MELRAEILPIPQGRGERSFHMNVLFSRPVARVHIALTGYTLEYAGGDHHLKRIIVKLFAEPGAHVDDGYEVRVTAVVNLRDQNGDDPYTGEIGFLLFAEPKTLIPDILR